LLGPQTILEGCGAGADGRVDILAVDVELVAALHGRPFVKRSDRAADPVKYDSVARLWTQPACDATSNVKFVPDV
jgi:hypothetical protein